MKNMEKLRDLVCMTLDEYADKGNMSMADLEAVYKMVDIIKDIGEIETMDTGYSRGYPVYRDSYSADTRRMRDDGHSYARHWVTGHYSRDDVKSDIIDRIRNAMDTDALSASDRSAMRKALEQLERM